MRRVKGSMGLDHLVWRNSRHFFQTVDVLRVVTEKKSFLMKEAHEVMGRRRTVRARKEVLRQSKERLWVFFEEIDFKNGLKQETNAYI